MDAIGEERLDKSVIKHNKDMFVDRMLKRNTKFSKQVKNNQLQLKPLEKFNMDTSLSQFKKLLKSFLN